MMAMNNDPLLLAREASEVGWSRGYDHANFVTAYGGDMDEAPSVPEQYADVPSYYLSGWESGVEAYQEGWVEDER